MESLGILFDLDGTLHDSERLAAEGSNHILRNHLKRELTASERQYLVGKPISKVLNKWFPEEQERLLHSIFTYYEQYNSTISAYAGIYEMLDDLKARGYKMGIVTSKLKKYAHFELMNSGMSHYFDVILAYEDSNEHKPHPLPLLQAAELLGFDSKMCIYIGDQQTDFIATRAAGMIGIAAMWGEGRMSNFRETKPDYYATSPSEVLEIITKMGAHGLL
jgi:pyrophosphatase PpaX